MKKIELYTDGACSGNPGPGGYGAILRFGDIEKELSGGEPNTTNNRMELLAAIVGLSALRERCEVTLYSDSQYLVNAIRQGWVTKWQKNGWKTASREPVKNPDLWQKLLELLAAHNVTFVWVKGHDGHPENERCDKLATDYIKTFQK